MMTVPFFFPDLKILINPPFRDKIIQTICESSQLLNYPERRRFKTTTHKELYKLHADFCKFMANPKRIEILFLLGEKEMHVEELAASMEIKLPNLSQHLAVMREKGVVESRREGNKIFYHLANPKSLQACILMREAMIEQMEKQMEMIKA
jgi:ArsR family transcriptional regulator